MAHWIPTDEDYQEVRRRFLSGLARGLDAHEIKSEMFDMARRHNTFPGECLMWLGADALGLAGFTRDQPLRQEELIEVFLPECQYRGKENQRIRYAVLTSASVHGGLEPDLLDEVAYWIEQYWMYALEAAVGLSRASAQHLGEPIDAFAWRLASTHGIDQD